MHVQLTSQRGFMAARLLLRLGSSRILMQGQATHAHTQLFVGGASAGGPNAACAFSKLTYSS